MVIVFGGSFNPPTKAHKWIIDELTKKFKPKKIIILPTGNDYNKKDLEKSCHRFNMLKLFENDVVEINDYEIKNKYQGTYFTLKNLNYDDIYFVLGYDNFISMNEWNNYEELVSNFKFILLNRNNDKIELDSLGKYKDNFILLNNQNIDISSTKFRRNKDFTLLDKKVEQYIKKNKLYRRNYE